MQDNRTTEIRPYVVASAVFHVLMAIAVIMLTNAIPAKAPEKTIFARLVEPPPVEVLPEPPAIRPPAPKAAPKARVLPAPRPVPRVARRVPVPEKPAKKVRPGPPEEGAGTTSELPMKGEGGTASAGRDSQAPGTGPAELPGAPGVTEGVAGGTSPGKMLFDRKAIEQALAERSREDNGITFDTDEMRYRSYMKRLKESIEYVWHYPRPAAERGIYGDLEVNFVIRKDGSLGEVKLVRTSGHQMLDEAAVQAIRDAAPFWPLPVSWGTEAFTVRGRFIYTLWGDNYVR